MPGPVLFARYAYPPSALGYCGPGDAAGMLRSASLGADLDELALRAARFDGAWPYLELIAQSNGMSDPLATEVVEAYWVGNELLANVAPSALSGRAPRDAGRRPGEAGRGSPLVERAAACGAVAQHSFHVFAVYPWLELLRAGAEKPALGILDRCRIRWGRVEALDGDFACVTSRRLLFDGKELHLGAPRPERVRRAVDGMGSVARLQPGDPVSLHWDWVCDRLSVGALRYLVWSTRRNLGAVNVLPDGLPA